MRAGFVVAGLVLGLAAGCDTGGAPASAPGVGTPVDDMPSTGRQVPLPDPVSGGRPDRDGGWFVDMTAAAGLAFVHFNGMSGALYMPEILPPGVGLVDVDADGDLDVFLPQGRMLGADVSVVDAVFPPPGDTPPISRLFRNEIGGEPAPGSALRFTDVTAGSGLDVDGYAMGVATGDIDNDGCVDLYVTSFGPNQLFRNRCDGTFVDITERSGTGDPGWSVPAAFLDYDRDGWLDLFVGNYLRYSLEMDATCHNLAGGRDYCTPQVFRSASDRLYRNRGDGTFTDVTDAALVGGVFGPALGVTTADFDDDGWIDVYVANDGAENQLWTNQGDGTFRDTALLAGAALSGAGQAEGSMGVDAGDFDNDGDEDVFMTHLPLEGNNLYVNTGTGLFDDQSGASGLGPASRGQTGFGAAWLDVDNDGWLDLLAVNGAIVAATGRERDPFPYGEPNRLFRNLGDGRFEDVTDHAGAAFAPAEVSRGAAVGDIDNDGDADLLIGNNSGPARLLVNTIGTRGHWLGVRLVGADTPRDMLGAVVRAIRPGAPPLRRRVRSDASYASANDPRVLFGLGTSSVRPTLSVRWPDGSLEEWTDVPIDSWTVLRQGEGTR